MRSDDLGGMVETVERLNEITRLQSEVITDLFELLSQYVTTEELDHLPVKEKVDEAAAIRTQIDIGTLIV